MKKGGLLAALLIPCPVLRKDRGGAATGRAACNR
jgi:hypothetical protein